MLTISLLLTLCGVPQFERPHLTTAQGYIESGLNSKAIGKKKEKGAWQVREKYWGKVPKKLIDQGIQSEDILNELLKESRNNIFLAVSKYNGSGRAAVRYAQKVRQRSFELAVCFV